MRRLARTTLLAIAVMLSSSALAQPAEVELDPPRGASALAYLDAVADDRLQVDIVYLDPAEAFDAEPDADPVDYAPAFETGGWVVLVLAVLLLLVLAYRGRHVLAELFASRDRRFGEPAVAEPPAIGEVDSDLLTRLRAETDPRTGLRLVLGRFLALAARENGVALRRHLTTREVLRLLPGSWAHRGDLERLAREVELTVFGGREMGRSEYEACLDLAAPHLRKVEAA